MDQILSNEFALVLIFSFNQSKVAASFNGHQRMNFFSDHLTNSISIKSRPLSRTVDGELVPQAPRMHSNAPHLKLFYDTLCGGGLKAADFHDYEPGCQCLCPLQTLGLSKISTAKRLHVLGVHWCLCIGSARVIPATSTCNVSAGSALRMNSHGMATNGSNPGISMLLAFPKISL